MKTRAEKACDTCGYRCFANCKDLVCPGAPHAPDCKGNLCTVITPLPGKRVSGVLCRDKDCHLPNPILFVTNISREDIMLDLDGVWFWPYSPKGEAIRKWSVTQWKEQYGKLPRKGSKSMVIIELISNGK